MYNYKHRKTKVNYMINRLLTLNISSSW